MFNPYTGYNGAMQNPYGFQPIATQQLQQE